MFGWPLAALLIFVFLEPRRAVLVALLAGWLFLPVARFTFPGVTYSRWVACAAGALLGVLLFDSRKILKLRLGWIDLPMIAWCLCPIPSSITNNLGFYDGFRGAVDQILQFAIPYILGRLYFHDPKGLREVAVGLFVGGLIYLPLCLIEMRMSPQLHSWVYGYHQHEWGQAFRFGGWRPVVFMNHGLEVGMWMSAASLAGVWLWMTGALRQILAIPVSFLVPPLLGTTVLCKSVGALALLACGLAALMMTRWPRTKWLLVGLILVPIAYIAFRVPALWSGDQIVEAARVFGEDRAESVHYRFVAEEGLARHAMHQPLFGWGGWGRNRPSTFDLDQPDLATDGLWIITLGSNGLFGLAGLLGTFLIPPLLLVLRLKTPLWAHPWCAPAAILAVVMILFMIDCLMNAMVNPFYLVAAGGLGRAVRAPLRRRASGALQPEVVEGRLGVS